MVGRVGVLQRYRDRRSRNDGSTASTFISFSATPGHWTTTYARFAPHLPPHLPQPGVPGSARDDPGALAAQGPPIQPASQSRRPAGAHQRPVHASPRRPRARPEQPFRPHSRRPAPHTMCTRWPMAPCPNAPLPTGAWPTRPSTRLCLKKSRSSCPWPHGPPFGRSGSAAARVYERGGPERVAAGWEPGPTVSLAR